MLKARFTWLFRTQLRTITVLISIVVAALLAFNWRDLCLWRAEVNLSRRHFAAVENWIRISQSMGQYNAAQLCLIKLRLARRKRDFREVELQLQHAAKAGVPRRDIQRERWLAMAQTEQFYLMESHWDELLNDPRDDEPEIALSYYTWSLVHHDLSQAMKTLQLWHQDFPKDPTPLALAGLFYQSIEDWEHAEEFYREALAVAPDNDQYRLSYANALRLRLKTKEAIPIYQEYRRRHPKDLEAVRGLAQCLATSGELAAALPLLDQANRDHPDDFETQKVYGEALLAAGEPAKAAELLQKAHNAVPEHANLAYSLGRSLMATERSKDAEPLFEFVAKSKPQLDLILDLEKQLRIKPGSLELRMKIAAITAQFISRRDAIRWYENILKLAPNYVPAHAAIADLYVQLGEEQNAEPHQRFVLNHQAEPPPVSSRDDALPELVRPLDQARDGNN